MVPTNKTTKRFHKDLSDSSDSETENNEFTKFIVIESLETTPLSKLSPFLIERVITSRCNPKTVKKTQKWKPSSGSY